jgi:hypothetical protein
MTAVLWLSDVNLAHHLMGMLVWQTVLEVLLEHQPHQPA